MFMLAAERSGLASLFAPQAGYLHLIPRLIAWPASYLDPSIQPGFYLLGWLVVTFAVVFACFSPRLDLPLKPLLAAAVLIVPHTGEVFFTPTNAQWVAALGILLTILKSDPRRPREWATDLAFVVVAGLSGPFSIFCLPLFFVRAWERRTLASFVLGAIAVAVAAVQGWFVAHAGPDVEFSGPFSLINLFATISFRLPTNLFFGGWITGTAGRAVVISLAAVILVFLSVALSTSQRYRRDGLRLLGFLFLLLAAATLRKRFDLWGWGDTGNGDRYFFVPKVLLLWVSVIVVAAQSRRWVQVIVAALLVCSVVSNAPRFQSDPRPDNHWYALCPDISAGREVEVHINPGWKFTYRRSR